MNQKKEDKAVDALITLCMKSKDIQGDSEKISKKFEEDEKKKETPKLELRNWKQINKNRVAP